MADAEGNVKIELKEATVNELIRLKKVGDTYDDVVSMLLQRAKIVKPTKKEVD